jgi:hypothetical protein
MTLHNQLILKDNMKSKFINLFLIFFFLALSGCGFTPVYAPLEKAENPQKFILHIKGDPSYSVYKLKRALQTYLPTFKQKVNRPITVKIELSESFGDIALNASAKVLRSQGQMYAKVKVMDSNATSTILLDTQLESVTSYTVQYLEEFAIISAESGARERMIKDLAQNIAHELQEVEVKS